MIEWELAPNVPLLQKTLHHIEANPWEWDQDVFRCGTAMCFAGTACHLDGGIWLEGDEESLAPREDDNPADVGLANFGVDGIHASIRAQRILGLNSGQAMRLFAAGNTLNDLRRIVGELCGEEAA
jgi:hypothetical protein